MRSISSMVNSIAGGVCAVYSLLASTMKGCWCKEYGQKKTNPKKVVIQKDLFFSELGFDIPSK